MTKKKAEPIYLELQRTALSLSPMCDTSPDYVVYKGMTIGSSGDIITMRIDISEYGFRIPCKDLASKMALSHLMGTETAVICKKGLPYSGDVFAAVAAISYEEYEILKKIIFDFDLLITVIRNESRTSFDCIPCELRVGDNSRDVILADSGSVDGSTIPEVPVFGIVSDDYTYIGMTYMYEANMNMNGKYMAAVCYIDGKLNILSLTEERLYYALPCYPDIRKKMALAEDICRMFPEREILERILYKMGLINDISGEYLSPIEDTDRATTVLKLLESSQVIGKNQRKRLLSKKTSDSEKEKARDEEDLLITANLVLSIVPFSFSYTYVRNIVSNDPILKYFADAVIRFVTRPGSSLLINGPRQTADVVTSRICRIFDLDALEYNISTIFCSLNLQGLTRRYTNGDYGKIINDLRFADLPGKAVFSFKNLDKATYNNQTDGDPIDFIPDLLSQGTFQDSCLDIPVDVSPIRIIATATSESGLRDGFATSFDEKIEIPIFSNNDSIVLAQWILSESFLSADEDTIQFLLDGYCRDDCMGDIVRYSRQISEIYENGEEILHLTKDDVLSVLGNYYEKNIYTLIRKNLDSYPNETFEQIGKTLDKMRTLDESKMKDSYEKKLSILARSGINGHSRAFDINLFRQQTSHLIGLSDQKEKLESLLFSWAGANSTKPAAILLEGPPGTGKTSLVNAQEGNIGGIPVFKRSLAGLTPDDVKGSENGGPGLITAPMADMGSDSYILVLDEADKAFATTRKAILDAIDGQKFYDNFLKTSVSLSNVVFVFISNSFNMEPEFIDRLSVIEFPGYTVFDKEKIVNNKLVGEYEETYGIRVCIESEALELMLRSCAAGGVRDIEKAFSCIFSGKYKDYDGSGAVSIKTEDVMHIIPRDTRQSANGVYALAIKSANMEGVTNRIVCVRNDSCIGIKHSGGLTGSMVESLEDAYQACRTIVGEKFDSFSTYIKIGSSGVEKDGPSAGAATALAMLFAFYDVEPLEKYGLSGEVFPDGTIGPVGGLKLKLQAAYLDGITNVFIPSIGAGEANHDLAEYIEFLKTKGMNITEVGHLEEIIRVIPEMNKFLVINECFPARKTIMTD